MTNAQITRAVARATGECLCTIQQIGFVLDQPEEPVHDETEHLWLDCSFCGQAVHLSSTGLDGLPVSAECTSCDTAFKYQFEEIYDAPKEGLVDRRRQEVPAMAIAG